MAPISQPSARRCSSRRYALLIPLLGRSFRIRHGETGSIVVLGLCSGFLAACYLSALSFVPVAIAVTVFYTFPLILILLAPLTGGGRITGWRMAAFAIAFARDHDLDPTRTIVVGRGHADRGFALRAGMSYVAIEDGWPRPG